MQPYRMRRRKICAGIMVLLFLLSVAMQDNRAQPESSEKTERAVIERADRELRMRLAQAEREIAALKRRLDHADSHLERVERDIRELRARSQ